MDEQLRSERRRMFGVDWKIWFIGFGWDDEGLLVTLGPICIWFDRRPR